MTDGVPRSCACGLEATEFVLLVYIISAIKLFDIAICSRVFVKFVNILAAN